MFPLCCHLTRRDHTVSRQVGAPRDTRHRGCQATRRGGMAGAGPQRASASACFSSWRCVEPVGMLRENNEPSSALCSCLTALSMTLTSSRRARFPVCAGIYGPSRSALDAVKQRAQSTSQLRRSRKRYTARCHVHDIWQAVHASIRSQSGIIDVINVVDDDPAPR